MNEETYHLERFGEKSKINIKNSHNNMREALDWTNMRIIDRIIHKPFSMREAWHLSQVMKDS